MLILSRKVNEGIIIGDIIQLKVIRIDGDTIKIGIEAPKEIPIFRTEIYQSAHSGSLKSCAIKSDRTIRKVAQGAEGALPQSPARALLGPTSEPPGFPGLGDLVSG